MLTTARVKPRTITGQPTLVSHLRAVLAVARKEWIIFRRYPSWVIAMVIWPILLPFGYIFTAKAFSGPDGHAAAGFAQLAGTADYAGFIVVGSTLWGWLNLTLWDVGFQLRNEQLHGTLESNWLCPVWRSALLLGGSLTKLATSLGLMVVTLLEFHLIFGIRLLDGNLPVAALVLLLLIPSV